MAGQTVPVRIGDVEVLVTTVPVPGTEPTSRKEQPGEWMRDAFDRAQAAVLGVAESTAHLVGELGQRAARPDKLEVEFGVSFTAKGNVILAGAEAGSTLKVKLTYDAASAD
jgi:hypothetical protein